LEELEKQANQEYEKAVTAAKEKRDKVLAAIATIREIGMPALALPSHARTHRVSIPGDKKERSVTRAEGTVFDIIKNVTNEMDGAYTSQEAYSKMLEVFPNVEMSLKVFQDKLSRLALMQDSIMVDSPRSGRIPAKYINIKPVA
jgi:hypothetical protein